MTNDIVVVGAGGFGREALDVIEAMTDAVSEDGSDSKDSRVLGVADDSPSPRDLERLASRDVLYLGTTDAVLRDYRAGQFVVGIGAPHIRCSIDAKFTEAGWVPFTAVHPAASIGSKCVIGEGSIICGGVQLSTNTTLGRHVHLNPNSTVGHDTRLGDFVSVNPGSIISGEVIVESGTLLGAGSVVLQNIFLGRNAVIGASACVVNDVERGITVIGVPARPLRSASYSSMANK